MKFLMHLLAASISMIAALPADARTQSCLDSIVFFGHRPAHVPAGILLVRVNARHWAETGIVDIVEPDDGLRNTSYIRVKPLIAADCSVAGSADAPSYMMGVLQRSSEGEIYFAAFEVRLPDPLEQIRQESNSRIVDPAFLPLARPDPFAG